MKLETLIQTVNLVKTIRQDMTCYLCLHQKCHSKPDFPGMRQLLVPQYTTYSRISLKVVFVVGPLVLPKENYLCNVQVWSCMLTKHKK